LDQWVPVVAALLTGGVVTAVVNRLLTRTERQMQEDLRKHESAVAGLAILVDQIQEERDYFREETHKLREDVTLLKLRVKALEGGV
jgi:ubiquinone biosynthesis protein UbiJ